MSVPYTPTQPFSAPANQVLQNNGYIFTIVDGAQFFVVTAHQTNTANQTVLFTGTPIPATTSAMVTATEKSTEAPSSRPSTSTGTGAANTASPSKDGGSSINGGAVAGAAVGCLIAGLAIGLVAAWVLFRRRKNPRQHSQVAITHEPKGHSSSATPSPSGDIQLSQFLLSATPDQDIEDEMQNLNSLIQQHVENNYHLQPIRVNPAALAHNLRNLGYTDESGLSADIVAALSVDPSTRPVALRHVIAHVIFKSVDVNSRSSLSMLPAPVAAFLQSIPLSGRNAENPAATVLALSKWRSLAAFLLHPRREDRTTLPVPDTAVGPQSLALAEALTTYLEPFMPTDKGGRQQQLSHLQAVIIECTKLGYVIFSHPNEWQFVFSNTSGGRAAIVCVGLDKLPQQDGGAYSTSPRRVFAPVMLQV